MTYDMRHMGLTGTNPGLFLSQLSWANIHTQAAHFEKSVELRVTSNRLHCREEMLIKRKDLYERREAIKINL